MTTDEKTTRADPASAEPKNTTMADIARLAGVSAITVSRALRASPLVNARTRERIADIFCVQRERVSATARFQRTRRAF